MQVLGLDIGEKRIGVASGSTASGVAAPVKVMPASDVLANGRSWRMLLEDYEPELLVCGCPKSMSGAQGKRYLREMGLSERDMRGKVDCVAASIFLQTWLAQQRR